MCRICYWSVAELGYCEDCWDRWTYDDEGSIEKLLTETRDELAS